jgi:hypothetical protein
MTDERICRWCFLPLAQEAESLCQDCTEKEAMLKEGLTVAPDPLARDDFERFLWKLAVYAIKTMEHPEGGTRWTLEHLRDSLTLALLQALPMDYISMTSKFPGDPKTGDPPKNVVYTVKKSIPKMLLFKTIERLGIWNPIEKDGDPENFAGA